MAKQHGRHTVITIGGDEVKATTSQLERGGQNHMTAEYGDDAEVYSPGLETGSFTMSGTYDSTAMTGPRAVIRPLINTVAEFTRAPEGTGTGKPLETFDAIIEKYVETNPIADMVTWSLDAKVSGGVADTTQS
jgi:hypothetical protein